MRVRTARWVILATALTTLLGSPAQAVEPSPSGSAGGAASADPFDESNAIDPGEAVLSEDTEFSIAGDPVGDVPVVPPTKPGGDDRALKPVVCDRNEQWIKSWQAVSASNVITHASGYVIPDGGAGKYSETSEFQTQLSATVTFNTGVTIGSPIIRSGLEAQVGFSVQASGSVTSRTSVTIETSVSKPGTYIFFAGRRKAKGSFVGARCNADGSKVSSVTGRMESYATPYKGAVLCGESAKAGSWKFIAQKYCD